MINVILLIIELDLYFMQTSISLKFGEDSWKTVRLRKRKATDVFTFNNKEYLVTVVYFSNFFKIDYLEQATSKIIIRKLKQRFARHGIPETLVSYQATVFKSEQFKAFDNEWDITHSY